MDNFSIEGCQHCGESYFFDEPPPIDILFLPAPPLHPSYQGSFDDLVSYQGKPNTAQQCSLCNQFVQEGPLNYQSNQNLDNRIIFLLIAFLSISTILFIYLMIVKRSRIMSSLRSKVFKSSNPRPAHQVQQLDKDGSIHASLVNHGHQCYLRTDQDKNFSPIVREDLQKTYISATNNWSKPESTIHRTIRRIPNEYEIASSHNYSGTPSAVYGDVGNELNQRLFSPYNLHTYAEVREVLDPNEHFHTSSNSSNLISDSNYDNPNTALNGGAIALDPVHMSNYNSRRMLPCNQLVPNSHQHPIYEQPPQRAQIIITSKNPTLIKVRSPL